MILKVASTKSINNLGIRLPHERLAWNGQIKNDNLRLKNAMIQKVASTKSINNLGIRLQHEGLAWNGKIKMKIVIKKRWFWNLQVLNLSKLGEFDYSMNDSHETVK